MFIIKKIISWLNASTYSNELERYIVGKNPTSTADVEHYTVQYQLKQSRRFV